MGRREGLLLPPHGHLWVDLLILIVVAIWRNGVNAVVVSR